MAILFTDLIPRNKDLVEKSTLHQGKPLEKKGLEPQESVYEKSNEAILQIPLETHLEQELAKIRYTKEEIEKAREEAKRKVRISYQGKTNAWSKKIKSKFYRKTKREEKQRKAAESIQLNMLEGHPSDDKSQKSQEKDREMQEMPEIVKAEETAYNFIKNTINTGPISIEEVHVASEKDKSSKSQDSQGKQIDSILEIDNDEFKSEKSKAEEADKPWEKEEMLLGWNTWGGMSIEPVKNSSNTTKVKRTGVEIRKRKDFLVSHVIYNEKTEFTRNQKYAIKSIPYGYTSSEEYAEVMSIPIDISHQPAIILNRLIKDEKAKRNHL